MGCNFDQSYSATRGLLSFIEWFSYSLPILGTLELNDVAQICAGVQYLMIARILWLTRYIIRIVYDLCE